MANGRIREYVQHKCDDCGSLVRPYTKFDAETVAPELGKKGQEILLRTYNSYNPENRIGWCWSCKDFRGLTRVSEAEIWNMYLRRRGVVVRTDRLRALKLVSRKVILMNKRKFVA